MRTLDFIREMLLTVAWGVVGVLTIPLWLPLLFLLLMGSLVVIYGMEIRKSAGWMEDD